MVNKANLDGHSLREALDKFVEGGLRQRRNRHKDAPTKSRKLVHVGM
jgi:hypothetical protein